MLDYIRSSGLVQVPFRLGLTMNLAARVTEAIETSGVRVATIAERCKISPQAVYDWMNGNTKEISGENLVELAELSGFDARWIAKGILPKVRIYPKTATQARMLEIMQKLPEGQEALALRLVSSVGEPPAKAG